MGTMDINFQQYFLEHLEALQNLIKIPSVYDDNTVSDNAPYGKGVADALDYMEALATADGFEVLSFDGHGIAIRMNEMPERIDVVSHLDVVEPGQNWSVLPFSGEVRNGRIYGRGSQDMKTPAFLTYLALKLIREEMLPLKRELRIVLGCDEERTMGDMLYYISKAGLPAFAFTPDGPFPMAIGEKGALMWRLFGSYQGIIEEMECGVQCNVISPVASAVLKDNTYTKKLKNLAFERNMSCTVTEEDGKTRIIVRGKAAHASRPEEGYSATVALFSLLKECGDGLMENLYECFFDSYGGALDPALAKDKAYTMNLGIFRIVNGTCYGEVDGRYPYGVSSKDCTEKLLRKCELSVSLDYDSPPTMNDPEDPFVNTLLTVYREKTKDRREPVISGGVSYSKVFGHCVSFGPEDGSEPFLAHQADESISLDACGRLLEIYYEAMKRIALLP